jgi:hypothetical protein
MWVILGCVAAQSRPTITVRRAHGNVFPCANARFHGVATTPENVSRDFLLFARIILGKKQRARPSQAGPTAFLMSDTIQISYSGNRYEATVPDTLDLAARAALAINGMGGTLDPELLTQYFHVFLCEGRPYLRHWGSSDTTCDTKWAQSFPMMRLMCGSAQHAALEAQFLAATASRVQDGLYWDLYDPRRPWRNSYGEKFYGKGKDEDFAVVFGTGRMIRAMLSWREAGDSSVTDEKIRSMVAGMRRVAIFKADYCYYPEKGGWGEPCAYPRSGWLNTDEPQSETEGCEGSVLCYHGNQIYGAAQWYQHSGDEEALELAARLTRFCMKPKFWGGVAAANLQPPFTHIAARAPDPPCTAGAELGHWFSHFHARAIALRGILQYAMAAHDERALEFVRRAYEFTLSQGIPRIGWISCYPVADDRCEACALADLVALAIRLTDAGLGEYWDDVDAIVRNHLVEQQLVDKAAMERAVAASANRPFPLPTGADVPRQVAWDNIVDRCVGIFGGTSTPTSLPDTWSMGCCTGNATQALYYAWEGIVRENGATATVNLFLNRAAKLVDVESYLPFEGKLVIKNKSARRLCVRIPAWVDRHRLRATVSGRPAPLDWVGRTLVFDSLKPADTLTLHFPLKETTARYTANAGTRFEQTYTCIFRGSTLVDISPRDQRPTSYPFYLRGHLRRDTAPMKKVTHFVADRIIRNW